MNLLQEVRERIGLLSDGLLYKRAIELARQHRSVDGAQLNGLLQYAQEWRELTQFVDKQRKRDWPQTGRKHHYKHFYDDLYKELLQLERNAAEFVPVGLARRQQQAQISFYAGLLAREFVQQLVAEVLFTQTVGRAEQPTAAPQGQRHQRREQ